MHHPKHPLSLALLAVLFASTLAACSSGGGSKSSSSDTSVVDSGDDSDSDSDSGDDGSSDDSSDSGDSGSDDAGDSGDDDSDSGSGTTTTTYTSYKDNVLVPTGVATAQAAGYTGAGVKVALLDSQYVDGYAPLADTSITYQDFTDYVGIDDDASVEGTGHGPTIAAIIAGTASGDFNGGVAQDVDLYWGRVCYNNSCSITAIGDAFETFTAAGVRLFNLSLGITYDAATASSYADLFAQYGGLSYILSADALVVAATGNDGAESADIPAAIPYYYSEYASNWLAVANVSLDSEGNVTGLDSTSNACGLAAQWCLVAPGYVAVVGVDGTSFADAIATDGTSNSAAIVTGVAALVWQAYPWMSASNVQQTILTTATDLGEEGVDSTYGWGLVNAAKAVNGPAQFTSDFTADVTTGYASTFSNAISGVGGLIKTGSGSLTLSAANTYTGDTEVEAGTLALSGSLTSDVTVYDGATFASYGGSIDGDYSALDGSTTAIQVGSGLSVSGTAALDGTLQLLAADDDYTVSASETVLTAGAISGTFDDVSYGSDFFYTATLDYDATSVTAELSRTSAASVASAAGMDAAVVDGAVAADALVAAVDGIVSSGDSSSASAIVATTQALITNTSSSATATALRSFSGQIHATASALGLQQALNDQRLLFDRVAELPDHAQDRGVWIQASAVDGTLRRDGYAGARYTQDTMMAGADAKVGDDVWVGVALAHDENRANIDSLSGNARGWGQSVSAYARAGFGPAYLAASVGYSDLTARTERTVTDGSDATRVADRHALDSLQVRLEAGYGFDNGLAPYLAVGGIRQRQGAIAEQATLGISADATTRTVGFADAGLRYGRGVGSGRLSVGVNARSVFSGARSRMTAAFSGLQSATFALNGQPLPQSSASIGAHYLQPLGRRAALFADVANEWATGQSHALYGTLGARLAF